MGLEQKERAILLALDHYTTLKELITLDVSYTLIRSVYC